MLKRLGFSPCVQRLNPMIPEYLPMESVCSAPVHPSCSSTLYPIRERQTRARSRLRLLAQVRAESIESEAIFHLAQLRENSAPLRRSTCQPSKNRVQAQAVNFLQRTALLPAERQAGCRRLIRVRPRGRLRRTAWGPLHQIHWHARLAFSDAWSKEHSRVPQLAHLT